MVKMGAALHTVLVLAILLSLPLFLATSPAVGTSSSPSGWWNENWTRRRPITITGTHPENYQLKVIVPYDQDMRADFGDIRFLENTTSGELSYWVENYTATSAKVWVRRLENTDSTIWLYYGNPTATSLSSVPATFIREIDGALPIRASWHMDESSGTAAHDTSGIGNHGTVFGTAGRSSGGNTSTTLNDNTKSWATNEWVGGKRNYLWWYWQRADQSRHSKHRHPAHRLPKLDDNSR